MNPLSFADLVKKNRTCRRFDHSHKISTDTLKELVEIAQIDGVGEDGAIKYWRDENQVHHVPKRSLNDLIHSTW